ncbi:MAG: GTP cyclohydrolase I [Anaerolineaceae bacterium]|jgi:GTP cyclohydrolase I|nr:GTP cyclohydrolase I [Anaerolineae bacterium]MDP3449021.1 GTP cyclohydrolase I [Anaerolineaceae bacterium]PKN98964.1 MAG: GTP cyclohydrolase I FolE [Chloroflexi bacterium HGW-Chloroflexi-5]
MTEISVDDLSIDELMQLNQRKITIEDQKRFEGYMAEIFTALGMDVNTSSTHETPRRFLEAMLESTSGYEGDPKLIKAFPKECRGEPDCRLSQVIEGPIHFHSLCEHHVFPFYGEAYVGYVADERILGISKLTRLVRLFTKRFAVQERIGYQIADTLEALMKPHGVAVFIRAKHMCVEMRGVREISPATRTTVFRGEYANDPALRSEFLNVCGITK